MNKKKFILWAIAPILLIVSVIYGISDDQENATVLISPTPKTLDSNGVIELNDKALSDHLEEQKNADGSLEQSHQLLQKTFTKDICLLCTPAYKIR